MIAKVLGWKSTQASSCFFFQAFLVSTLFIRKVGLKLKQFILGSKWDRFINTHMLLLLYLMSVSRSIYSDPYLLMVLRERYVFLKFSMFEKHPDLMKSHLAVTRGSERSWNSFFSRKSGCQCPTSGPIEHANLRLQALPQIAA